MKDLVEKAEQFVRAHMAAHFPATITYHNAEHAAQVAQAAVLLAEREGVPAEDRTALLLAAWFHDAAYHLGADGHEEQGAELAAGFLRKEGADKALEARTRRLILATDPARVPADALEALIRDADNSHIASEDYMKLAEALRSEMKRFHGRAYGKRDWTEQNIAVLERSAFSSATAKALWDEGRRKNLEALRRHLAKLRGKAEQEKAAKRETDAAKAAKAKFKGTERGTETLFRVTMNNHMRLSRIADNKAHLMLTVNALIITLLIAKRAAADLGPTHVWPTGILLVTNVLSIITATLATWPKVTRGITSKESVRNRTANLLFFGNFHRMKVEDFQWGIDQVIGERDFLYGSLTRDLYYLGRVLNTKYNYLRATYLIFMLGIVAAVVAFICTGFL